MAISLSFWKIKVERGRGPITFLHLRKEDMFERLKDIINNSSEVNSITITVPENN